MSGINDLMDDLENEVRYIETSDQRKKLKELVEDMQKDEKTRLFAIDKEKEQ